MIRTLMVALLARAAAEQLRVVAMGDSNTAGGAGGMDELTESYPAQLSVLLGGEDWDVRNFGKGGRTVVILPSPCSKPRRVRRARRHVERVPSHKHYYYVRYPSPASRRICSVSGSDMRNTGPSRTTNGVKPR